MYEYDNKSKFDSIEVTLAMGCRVNCKYCPQALLLEKYFKDKPKRKSVMEFEDFKIIISKVKRGGTICFSGMCEAFHNKQCTDMILYAYEQGYKISLLTTLIGAEKSDIDRLKRVKFDSITLHIPDEQENSKIIVDDKYLEVFHTFHSSFQVSSYSCHGAPHHDIVNYLSEKIVLSSKMFDRAGNLQIGKKSSPKGEIVCMVGTIGHYGNWTPQVLPDGTVTLCCMDYAMKHVLGNILTMEVGEIISGREYRKVVEGMKDENRDILCRKCSGAKEISALQSYKFREALEQYYLYGDKLEISEAQKEIIKKFEKASKICVYGLGKLFWNNFFNQRWNEVLEVDFYCDANQNFYGKEIDGIKCISPEILAQIDNCLVIVHANEFEKIRRQLEELGIENALSIHAFYRAF